MIKNILISQPAPASDHNPYKELSEKYGLNIVFHPFIKVEPITERQFRDQKVNILDYNTVIFSSRHAIDNYFRMCKDLRVKVPEEMMYYGVSETVILYIQKYVQYRKRKISFSPTGKWAELMPAILKHKSNRYLIPHGNQRIPELTSLLDERGIQYKECEMFRTVPNDFTDGTSLADFDAVVLFTPSGVKSLVQNFPEWEQGDTKLICFGDTTCKAVEGTNLRLDYSPKKGSVTCISAGLEEYINKLKKEN